jgi:hypothetical protein
MAKKGKVAFCVLGFGLTSHRVLQHSGEQAGGHRQLDPPSRHPAPHRVNGIADKVPTAEPAYHATARSARRAGRTMHQFGALKRRTDNPRKVGHFDINNSLITSAESHRVKRFRDVYLSLFAPKAKSKVTSVIRKRSSVTRRLVAAGSRCSICLTRLLRCGRLPLP